MSKWLAEEKEHLERDVLAPMVRPGPGFAIFVVAMLAVIAWGTYAWMVQIDHGLGVTGLSDRIPWGFYIANFVFWVGVSHAGTFISAVLRLTDVGWRTPIVRMAEFMTIGALFMGAAMPLVDMGRPDRLLYIIKYGSLTSPILWDILSITTYLFGSLIYLYLPLIPDMATARDRLGPYVGPFRRGFFRVTAMGWHGTPEQWQHLMRAIRVMCVVIIGVMISVHTVVSWIFGMTLRPGWHSTIFGPYFVIGAIFSGLAAVITGMAIFRKAYGMERYFTVNHFRWLGNILLTAGLVYFYFTMAEYATIGYKLEPGDKALLQMLLLGTYAPFFWFYAILGHLVPMLMLALPWTRNIFWITVASVLINLGMWVKRYVITIPSLAVPQMGYEVATYGPTWIEVAIISASFAGFALIVGTLARVFPLIPMWEQVEELEKEELRRAISHQQPELALGGEGDD